MTTFRARIAADVAGPIADWHQRFVSTVGDAKYRHSACWTVDEVAKHAVLGIRQPFHTMVCIRPEVWARRAAKAGARKQPLGSKSGAGEWCSEAEAVARLLAEATVKEAHESDLIDASSLEDSAVDPDLACTSTNPGACGLIQAGRVSAEAGAYAVMTGSVQWPLRRKYPSSSRATTWAAGHTMIK